MRKILGCIRKADEQYHLIDNGETLAVAVSGGKDSMLLLKALQTYRLFPEKEFNLHAICLDLGFDNIDLQALEVFCKELSIPLTIRKTEIGDIVFQQRQEKNPCSLCAKLKRGALHDLALELGVRKIALGHHGDDYMETFLLGLFYEGRINSFKPLTFLDRKQVTTIRPMILAREKDIIYAVNKNNIPVIKSSCPVDGLTRREDMKQMIKQLSREIPQSDERLLHASLSILDWIK